MPKSKNFTFLNKKHLNPLAIELFFSVPNIKMANNRWMSTGSWACDPPSNGFLGREVAKEVKMRNLDEIIPGVIQPLRKENCAMEMSSVLPTQLSFKSVIKFCESENWTDCVCAGLPAPHSPAPGVHVTAVFVKTSLVGWNL